MAEPTDADIRLMAHARSLGEAVALISERMEKARAVWIEADWRRLKAVEDADSPNRITFLSAVANGARKNYDEVVAYYNDTLASNADYIRTEVRNG